MDNIKLCVDCNHTRPYIRKVLWFRVIHDQRIARCAHPKAVRKDLVTGEEDPQFCSAMRVSVCGPDGKLWEAK